MTGERWAQLASRLRSMDRDELVYRSRQEFSKRWDTFLSRLGLTLPETEISPQAPDRADSFLPRSL
jgi:hypothetical protein